MEIIRKINRSYLFYPEIQKIVLRISIIWDFKKKQTLALTILAQWRDQKRQLVIRRGPGTNLRLRQMYL